MCLVCVRALTRQSESFFLIEFCQILSHLQNCEQNTRNPILNLFELKDIDSLTLKYWVLCRHLTLFGCGFKLAFSCFQFAEQACFPY